MDEIANKIKTALQDLNLSLFRLFDPGVSNRTDPWIVYNKVSDNIEDRADDKDTSALFYIDVDIYTTNQGLIDITRSNVETRLKNAGFSQLASGATIVEDDSEPTYFHEPLQFLYKKELI